MFSSVTQLAHSYQAVKELAHMISRDRIKLNIANELDKVPEMKAVCIDSCLTESDSFIQPVTLKGLTYQHDDAV